MIVLVVTGHNGDNNRRAHLDFRSALPMEETVLHLIKPLQDKHYTDCYINTECERVRYCLWMENHNWEEQVEYTISLLNGLI